MTTRLTIARLTSNAFATYGHLLDDELRGICTTLELPWLDNEHDVSCIPAGEYTLTLRWSEHHQKNLYWVDGVPDRDSVELHIGNLPGDSRGCVLLGTSFGMVNGQPGIVGSADAFRNFMARMNGLESCPITVTETEISE